MDIKRFKENRPLDSNMNRDIENNDANDTNNSALDNNKNDLVSNQGNSGIKDVKMVKPISKIEKEYLIRSERFDRDEENPMYDSADETWGAPDNF